MIILKNILQQKTKQKENKEIYYMGCLKNIFLIIGIFIVIGIFKSCIAVFEDSMPTVAPVPISQATQQQAPVTNTKPQEVKPVIRTFKGYKFTELYRYPEFGLYLFAIEKEYIPIDDIFDVFTGMRKTLEYGENDSLQVFVYNYKPNISKVSQAPKTIPAQMLINATELMPKYVFGGWSYQLHLEVQQKGACQRFATSVHNNFQYEEWFKQDSPLCGFVLDQ